MMIVNASKASEVVGMPSQELINAMMKYNDEFRLVFEAPESIQDPERLAEDIELRERVTREKKS